MQNTPIGGKKDAHDENIARWGRSRHEGYRKFKHGFLQPAPLFFTQDHHPLWISDTYRGRSAFLICSGPSFATLDHSLLRQPGIVTMGLNNSPRTFRPNMWTCVDSPDHWIRSIWLDPLIQKFVPICMASKYVFDSNEWIFTDQRVGDCPNVAYYKRNEHFKAKQFLFEDGMNWGNHKDHGGGRSIMLPAVKILFLLGFRRVYLLGCDMDMSPEKKYHFEQDRAKGAISGNNDTYKKMNKWFKELRPLFEEQNFNVFNCNSASKLTSFDHISFPEAIDEARSHMDFIDCATERTRGLYDTKTDDKRKGKGK